MSLPWFKLWDEAGNDPKLETLTDAQHRVWFKMMCMANRGTPRGTIAPRRAKLLAIEVAGGDESLLAETLRALEDLDIRTPLDDGTASFVNWEKRQSARPSGQPSATAQRKREQRERDRAEGRVTRRDRVVTGSDISDVTRGHATEEKEIRLEEDRESASVAGGVGIEGSRGETASPPTPPPSAPAEAPSVSGQERELATVTPIRPPSPEPPPRVQQQLALREQLFASAADLRDRKLTKAEERRLNGWWNEHKAGLTPEIIAEAEGETASHTPDGALDYFIAVMQRMIERPDARKPPNGRHGHYKRAGPSPTRTSAATLVPAMEPRRVLVPTPGPVRGEEQ